MDFAKEILDAIEIIVKQTVLDKSTKIYAGICKSANSNGVCELDINGKINAVRYYGGTPKFGEIYRVFVPSNNMSTAFIIVPGSNDAPVTAVTSYNDLIDLPKINGVTLQGNKTSADLSIGDKTFTYTQSSALATWEINHNLAKYPAISVVDSGGNTVIGEIKYIDQNNLTISFMSAFSGKAYLN